MALHSPFTRTTAPTLVAEDVVLDGPIAPGETLIPVDAPGGRTSALPKLTFDGDRPRLLVIRERRYTVLRPLGAGGAGEVFLAVDQDIGRQIAIKKVPSAATSRAALVRFIREVQTTGRLEHPNIVPIHDVGQDENGDYYFVMKYVEGLTLEEVIDRLRAGDEATHRRFGFEARVEIVRHLMEALAFAHERGVVHRDIKPGNVMIGPFGEVSLLDWGIAQSADPQDGFARDGVLIGTPLYMSPEQAARRAVDARSDVYSLSVLMHELLTLRHYLDGVTDLDALLDGVQTRPVPLATLVRHPAQGPVPMDLSWFVHRGVHKDRDARFGSMREMLDALDRRAAGEVRVECPVTLTKRMTYETVRATDRYLVPLLGPILRGWAWGLGRFGGRAMTAVALGLFGAGLVTAAAAALATIGAALGAGIAIGVAVG